MKNTSDFPLLKGFTLLELMIVVFIVAMLAMIAIPSYKNHVHSSRRLTAISELLQLQLLQSRYRTTHTSYATTEQLGMRQEDDYYSYSVKDVSATSYTLNATAKVGTSQINDTRDGTSCSTLTLNQSNTKTLPICWPK